MSAMSGSSMSSPWAPSAGAGRPLSATLALAEHRWRKLADGAAMDLVRRPTSARIPGALDCRFASDRFEQLNSGRRSFCDSTARSDRRRFSHNRGADERRPHPDDERAEAMLPPGGTLEGKKVLLRRAVGAARAVRCGCRSPRPPQARGWARRRELSPTGRPVSGTQQRGFWPGADGQRRAAALQCRPG